MAATGALTEAAAPIPRVVSSIDVDVAGLADGTRPELSLEVGAPGDAVFRRLEAAP